ncbi:hypothetical protein OTK49_20855 [Vibrio coralliirubri]|nr:hypothetical protein [Vibrio coralliirubri]
MDTISVDDFNECFSVGSSFIWQRSRFLRGGLAINTLAPAYKLDGVVVVKINTEQQQVVPVAHLTPLGNRHQRQ